MTADTMDIGMNLGRRLLPGLAALLAAVAGPVAAQGEAAAGRFIAVTGEVKILGSDGVTRSAQRDGELRQGDSIVTGANSLAQLRMSDGGAVSVRAETQLKLDGYRFRGAEDRESSFAVSILKGGFRMITGLIARNNRQSYRVSTSSMTLGVRGTHFEVVHVLQAVSDATPGTYNRVYDGTIAVQNRAGASVVVSPGQTAFVALPSNLPPVLVAPPVAIFGKATPVPQPVPQPRGEGKADGGAVPGAAHKDKSPASARGSVPAPSRTLSAPLLNPIDTPRVVETVPTTTTISPTLVAPTTTTISPTLISPTTTTIAPTTTTISPTTTTISPTLISPTTTTIAPTTTTISPTTTTISPTLISPTTTTTTISPTTTTISPTLISPTTTTISPTTTTISPTLTSPTLTAPTTTTIKR